jgi:hypothetical protein
MNSLKSCHFRSFKGERFLLANSRTRSIRTVGPATSQHLKSTLATLKFDIRNIENKFLQQQRQDDNSSIKKWRKTQRNICFMLMRTFKSLIAKRNIQKTHLQHECETYTTLQHLISLHNIQTKHRCNIDETFATFARNIQNLENLSLQHAQNLRNTLHNGEDFEPRGSARSGSSGPRRRRARALHRAPGRRVVVAPPARFAGRGGLRRSCPSCRERAHTAGELHAQPRLWLWRGVAARLPTSSGVVRGARRPVVACTHGSRRSRQPTRAAPYGAQLPNTMNCRCEVKLLWREKGEW